MIACVRRTNFLLLTCMHDKSSSKLVRAAAFTGFCLRERKHRAESTGIASQKRLRISILDWLIHCLSIHPFAFMYTLFFGIFSRGDLCCVHFDLSSTDLDAPAPFRISRSDESDPIFLIVLSWINNSSAKMLSTGSDVGIGLQDVLVCSGQTQTNKTAKQRNTY